MRILVTIGAPRREAENFNFYISRAIGRRTRESHAARRALGPTQKRRRSDRRKTSNATARPMTSALIERTSSLAPETTIDRKLKDETRRRIERELDLREAVLANRRNEN